MREDAVTLQRHVQTPLVYRLFKYTVYCLLAYNVYLFFLEDHLAASAMFTDGVTWRNLVDAYPATVDTAWWVVLLLLFELETAVIPDEKLRGGLKWLLMAIRSVSYFFIVMAFRGYILKYGQVSGLEPFAIADVCTLVDTAFTYVSDLDEYLAIDAAACAAMQGQDLYRIVGTDIIGTGQATRAAINLAMVDIVNAADWLVIVVLLETEVLLQLWDRLTDRLIRVFKYLKTVLYGILFGAAAYWGVLGDFLDFWDAFLWLVAFIFIELNIFQWHAEVEEEKAHQAEIGDHAS